MAANPYAFAKEKPVQAHIVSMAKEQHRSRAAPFSRRFIFTPTLNRAPRYAGRLCVGNPDPDAPHA
jgi:hypothetical protein